MKVRHYFAIGLACLVGALAAFQVDRLLRDDLPWRAAELDAPILDTIPAMPVAQVTDGVMPDFRAAARRLIPSVVSIDTRATLTGWLGETFTRPLGSGSGVVLTADGYILTNNHVLRGPGGRLASQVRVQFSDGSSASARIVGTDPRADLAVLRVARTGLRPAELARSRDMEVGQWVIAVGNPLDVGQTVSVGVVSGLNRNLETEQGVLVGTIQTDAAINPGNSGGALANANGAVIGINTAIASTTGGSIGIGFAIPIERAKRVAEDIIRFGRPMYGTIGVQWNPRSGLLRHDQTRRELAELTGAEPPRDGVVIRRVAPGSPAEAAGLRPADVVLAVDGKPLREPNDLLIALYDKRPGESVRLRVWQRGTVREVQVTLRDLTQS
jgi:putative serine protease PepD